MIFWVEYLIEKSLTFMGMMVLIHTFLMQYVRDWQKSGGIPTRHVVLSVKKIHQFGEILAWLTQLVHESPTLIKIGVMVC